MGEQDKKKISYNILREQDKKINISYNILREQDKKNKYFMATPELRIREIKKWLKIFVHLKVSDNFLSSAEGREIIIFFVYLRLPELNNRPMQCILVLKHVKY